MGADSANRTMSDSMVIEVRAIFDGKAPGSAEFAGDVTGCLREALLRGVLPAGTWLTEASLAKTLGVSRTPAREAIRSLEAERLAVRQGGSAVIPKMSADDVHAVYVVREALEGLAAGQAAARPSMVLVAELERVNSEMRAIAEARLPGDHLTGDQIEAVAAGNRQFHRAISEAVNNDYLDWFLTQVERAIRRAGATTFDMPETLAQVVDEHERIIEAIRSADSEQAAAAAREHASRSRRRRLRMHLGRY